MSTKKAGGSSKNLRDSNPKYLGVKLTNGAQAQKGSIIIRQRGTKFIPGDKVGIGRDHTLFALADGVVHFADKRKKHFDNTIVTRKLVSIKTED